MNISQAQLPEGFAPSLPRGWEIKKLGDCFRLKSGENLTAKNMNENGKYPVFGGNGIAGYYNSFNLEKNNVIIGRVGALCGNVRHINENIWLTDNAFKVVDYKFDFDNSFLTYLLNFKNLRSYARQTAQPVISNSSLKEIILSFPRSKEEQQRIVSILDRAFAAIDQAKANAEKNLQNAKELFESYITKLFDNDEWQVQNLEDICENIFAGGDAPKENFSKEPTESFQTPIYANAVKKQGLYGYTDKARVTKPAVSIAARGSGTGHTELRKEPFLPIVRLIVCVPKIEKMEIEFLKYSIDNLVIARSGSAIPQLTVPMIKTYKIPVPPLDVQELILDRLGVLSEEIQKLEILYQKKIGALDELKKSILQKAFKGELETENKLAV